MREVLSALEARGITFSPHELVCLICPECSALPQQRIGPCDACSQISFPGEETCFFVTAYLERTAKESGSSDFRNTTC